MMPVLQEPNEGGNPRTRSNHDNRGAGVVWEVEWIEDSRKDWNLKSKITSCIVTISSTHPLLLKDPLTEHTIKVTIGLNGTRLTDSSVWYTVHTYMHVQDCSANVCEYNFCIFAPISKTNVIFNASTHTLRYILS